MQKIFNIYISTHNGVIYRARVGEDGTFLKESTPVLADRKLSVRYLGLDYYKDYFYLAAPSNKQLFKLSSSWKIQKIVSLKNLDAHGVDCFSDKVVVSNPSGMHAEVFDLNLNLIEVFDIPLYEKIKYPKENIVRHHINAFQQDSNGTMYYSVTYVPDVPDVDDVRRREAGYVIKITENGEHVPVVEGLHLPHSLRIKDDHIYICTKKGMCVEKYTLMGTFVSRTKSLPGWARGLCPLENGIWVVGLSCSRTRAFVQEPPRDTAGLLTIKENADNTWECLDTLDIASREIFDIIYSGETNMSTPQEPRPKQEKVEQSPPLPVKASGQEILKVYQDAAQAIYDTQILNSALVYFIISFARHSCPGVTEIQYVTCKEKILDCMELIKSNNNQEKFKKIDSILRWAKASERRWQDHLVDDFLEFEKELAKMGQIL